MNDGSTASHSGKRGFTPAAARSRIGWHKCIGIRPRSPILGCLYHRLAIAPELENCLTAGCRAKPVKKLPESNFPQAEQFLVSERIYDARAVRAGAIAGIRERIRSHVRFRQ